MIEDITIESDITVESVGSGYSGATVVEIDTSGHKNKYNHMGEPSTQVHLDNNSSQYYFFNLMISVDFRSSIFQECTNMRAAMEGAGRKGDRYRTTDSDFNPLPQEEIGIYLGFFS